MLKLKYSDLSFGCFECRHLNPDYSTCPAYPEGIPEEILTAKIMHKEIRKDQIGSIVFEKSSHIAHRFDKILAWKVIKLLSDENYKNKNQRYKNGLLFAIKTIIEAYKIKKPTN